MNEIITIEMNNVLPTDVDKVRDCFIQLAASQIHRVNNGKVILDFSEGKLMNIWVNEVKWKRKKVLPLDRIS